MTGPIYIISLRAEPSCDAPERAVRALLKLALRRFGLRCISVAETPPPTHVSEEPRK